jgi:hypothetical protein
MQLAHGIAALALVVLSSAQARAEDDKRPPEVGVLGGAEPLLPIRYRVDVRDEGPVYQAVAHLTFRNAKLRTVEGVALVPIAPDSIPRGVLVVNGATQMRGVVRSRDRAVDAYRNLTRAHPGRDPAVVERLDDLWLKATLAPVAADDAVELQVSYLGFSERVGDRREVALPTARRALRGNGGGATARWLDGGVAKAAPAAASDAGVDLGVWCFRAPGGEGTFCLELDPSTQLATRLPGVTDLLVVETPESTDETLARAGGSLLAAVVDELREGDRVELWSDAHDSGLFGELASADAGRRETLAAELARNDASGWGWLESRVEAALARTAATDGPVRLIVVSSQRRITRAAALADKIAQAACAHGDDFACFTVALGSSAETTALADWARAGCGRAFVLPAAADATEIGRALAAAALRPVLRNAEVTVAGPSELVSDGKRHVTYGETLRVVGRYDEATTSLVRLQGRARGVAVDVAEKVELPEEEVTHPWVATIWAGLRAKEIRRSCTGPDPDPYLTRLCERYGLLGPETVSLSLEPALSNRMPPLIGAPGQPVAQLDRPVTPVPPTSPSTPTGCPPDERRDPRKTVPNPINLPNGPNGNPSPLPPHPTAPSLPPVSAPPPSMPPRAPGGHL